ncbi:MAG TPA: SUF system NifU family Fe-S cluster assembly protein [archaeon]|nr:SUF system NifU family Fe-S cluster assembly protein [archaeon]
MSLDMYAEQILDYYKNPRNFGEIKNAQIHARDLNPLCGDEIEIFAKANGQMISEIKFKGVGCAISMASASMLTEKAKGKNISEVMKFGEKEILEMLGIEVSPARKKCAMLGLWVLQMGLKKFLEKK